MALWQLNQVVELVVRPSDLQLLEHHLLELIIRDDLMLFCKANSGSTIAILKILSRFQDFSGLKMNYNKSSIIIGGLSNDAAEQLANNMGIVRLKPPFRYLGMPLLDARMGVKDCQPLVDAMTRKIQSWKTKGLSHAGRVVLVKSVLSSIQTYWARTMILPKTVTTKLQKMCTRFIWAGPGMKKGIHQVSCRLLTRKKKNGGLNLTDLEVWNKAAICGLLFRLASKQAGHWVEWMWGNRVKNKNLWTMKIPQDSSWSWRKILESREDAAKIIRWKIKDGTQVSFWHDIWATSVPLAHLITDQMKSNSGVADQDLVNVIIHNQVWDLSNVNLPHNIIELILQVEIDHRAEKDDLIWTATTSGEFSVKSTYNILLHQGQKKTWSSVAWNKWSLPRHNFLAWQVFTRGLLTQNKLQKMGIIEDSQCCLCQGQRESINHLFFDCLFSKQVWRAILLMMQIDRPILRSKEEWKWIFEQGRRSGEASGIFKAMLTATMYWIWYERNLRRFKGTACSSEIVAGNIIREMRRVLHARSIKLKNTIDQRKMVELLNCDIQFYDQRSIACAWEPPEVGFVKLNADGSIKENHAGFGGLVRDSEGDVLLMYRGCVEGKTILYLELKGILEGLKLCLLQRHKKVMIASDSMNGIQCIRGEQKVPWYTRGIVAEIQEMCEKLGEYKCLHIFRETNAPADYLAGKNGSEGTTAFINPMEEELARLVQQDKEHKIYHRLL